MAIVYTQTDLDNLNEALMTGAEEVRIGERTIKYRSQAQLLALIKMVQENLEGTATSSTVVPSLIKPTFSKGQL